MITELIIWLTNKAITVTVPYYPSDLCPYVGNIRNSLMYWGGRDYQELKEQPLPPGSWSILGRGNELTEEQWTKVVEWYRDSNDSSYDPQYNETTYFNVYKDYVDDDQLDTATESGLSLLKSKSLDPNRVIILIKQ